MQGTLQRYNLTTTLAKKYSHSTYLASSVNEPIAVPKSLDTSEREEGGINLSSDSYKQQVILIEFSSSLFSSPHERETLLQKAQHIKELQHPHILPILGVRVTFLREVMCPRSTDALKRVPTFSWAKALVCSALALERGRDQL